MCGAMCSRHVVAVLIEGVSQQMLPNMWPGDMAKQSYHVSQNDYQEH